MEKTNAGYRITSATELREYWVTMGHNPSAPAPYVTWEYSLTGGFYWGHYFGTYRETVIDYCNRILAGLGETADHGERDQLPQDLTACAEVGSWYDLEQTLAACLCTGSAPWYDQPDRGEGG